MGAIKAIYTDIETALQTGDYMALKETLEELDEGVRAQWLFDAVMLMAKIQEDAYQREPQPTAMDFDTWKAEFVPVIYEDTGAECYDHETCECEFLYTFSLEELQENEEHATALHESRVWTWNHIDGSITSGLTPDPKADLLVTAKPYTERMIIK